MERAAVYFTAGAKAKTTDRAKPILMGTRPQFLTLLGWGAEGMLRRLPIGKKVIGLVSTLLLLMLLVATYSFVQTNRLRDEIIDLSDELIPLVSALTTVDARTLEQERILERALRRLRDTQPNRKRVEADLKRFRKLSREVLSSISSAETLAATGARKARIVEDAIELAQVQVFLQGLRREHRAYQHLAEELLQRYERMHKTPESLVDAKSRAEYEVRLEAAEDQLDRSVGAVLQGLEAFTAQRARRLRQDEEAFLLLSLENLALAVIAFALGVAFATIITRRIVRPLHKLLVAAQEVSAGNLNAHVEVESSDEVGELSNAFNEMVSELRTRQQIKEAFGKYVDPRIVENLIDPVATTQNSGQRQVMTVMFSDVARFSQLAEKMTPSGLVKVINRYLTLATEPIAEQKGVVDKYIGDAVMAFWGPPFTSEKEHAILACKAALAQLEQLQRFRDELPELLGFRKGIVHIDVRIGLCTGDLVIGNIGSNHAKSFTVMGDTVNLASRLEGANKAYGTRILLTESTQKIVQDHFELREIDNLRVVGKDNPVRVFELLAHKGELAAPACELRDSFERGLRAYRAQAWNEAVLAFQACLEIQPQDGPAKTFLHRIEALQQKHLATDWDGVWQLDRK